MKKNFVFILLTLVINGCSAPQERDKDTVGNTQAGNSDWGGSVTKQFVPDSSYTEYWCSSQILEKTAHSMGQLDLVAVAEFLASFHEDCKNDTAYSRWSNRLLFEVAARYPDFVLQLLFKNDSLDKALIKRILSSPPPGDAAIDELITRMGKANAPTEIKEEIIGALKIAASKK